MDHIKQIALAIAANGGRCFYVGGYVRDQLLNRQAHDIDIECFHISYDTLSDILQQFGVLSTVGRTFGILKLSSLPDIDFALPRTEIQTGQQHQDFAITIDPKLPYHIAAKRRDFTCNALLQDIITGEILDYFGGIADITRKCLRHVDQITFIEDELRGLRAAQLAARLGFTIDNTTQSLIQTFSYQHLSQERIRSELIKGMLWAQKPSYFCEHLRQLKIFDTLIPPLGTMLSSAHTLYPLIDATVHLTYEHMFPNFPLTQLIILSFQLLPDAQQTLVARFISNHKARQLVLAFNASLQQLQHIADDSTYRRLKYQCPNIEYLFRLASSIEHYMPSFLPSPLTIHHIRQRFEQAITNNPKMTPLIQGRDLIELGFQPSQQFSKLLAKAFDYELQGFDKASIITRLQQTAD